MKDELIGIGLIVGWIAILLVLFGALVAVIMIPAAAWEHYNCNRYGRITGREVRFALPSDCYVRTAHGWYTVDQLRDIR